MQRLYSGHLVALIIFFFMMLVHRKSLQVLIANIEVTGFDPIAFASPTYTFGICSLFFCALTILVTVKKISGSFTSFIPSNGLSYNKQQLFGKDSLHLRCCCLL